MVSKKNLPALLLNEAREWIGTKFQHQGRVKKSEDQLGGCDCLGLIVGLAKKFRLKSKYDNCLLEKHDRKYYSRFPNKNKLLENISLHLSVAKRKHINTGDVGLFRIGKYPQHLGVFVNDGSISMIHAYQEAESVIENSYSDYWQSRLVQLFSFNEIC